jgi:uncharacterized protein YjdB
VVQVKTGVPINPAALTLVQGDSGLLAFTAPDPRPGDRVTVSSSDPAVAEPTASETTARGAVYVRGIGVGRATLTVTFVGRQTITGTVPVTVTGRPTVRVAASVSPVFRTLGVGDTARFLAAAVPTWASQDVRVTPQSRDTSVVAVDSAGLATARRVGVSARRASAVPGRPAELDLQAVPLQLARASPVAAGGRGP